MRLKNAAMTVAATADEKLPLIFFDLKQQLDKNSSKTRKFTSVKC